MAPLSEGTRGGVPVETRRRQKTHLSANGQQMVETQTSALYQRHEASTFVAAPPCQRWQWPLGLIGIGTKFGRLLVAENASQ